ncbi:MAG: nucleotidyltransferase domain-containing protein [Candidatus Sigynarchaeota archaeon]
MLDRARRDLASLAMWPIILFGSCIEGQRRPRSDIDVAIITMDRDKRRNLVIFKELLQKIIPPYEMHIFELLPLHIRRTILEKYAVVFGDPVVLAEYFYITRKEWNDCKHRILQNQFSSYKEKLYLMQNRSLL